MQFIDLKTQQTAIKEDLERRIAAVLAHGQYIMGPEVAELETALSAYVGVRHCVSVSSGTEALLIALMALGVGHGDEVITTPFTFVATAEVIVLLGAKPIFVDVDPRTANIDPTLIAAKITPRTKAIIPVSLYGQVAEMDAINAIAAEHGIPVIEDGCQSFGSDYHGRKSCGLSTFGATSFFPSKPLGCYGDGGALFTDDDALAQAAREIRVHGQSKRYVHTRIGVGGRMDTLQCAIVLAKLPRFDWEVSERVRIGTRYDALLRETVPGFCTVDASDLNAPLTGARSLAMLDGRTSVHAQYTVLVPNRAEVQSRLLQAGVPTAVHYPIPLNAQDAYRNLGNSDPTPASAWLGAHVMSLPMGPDLTEADQDHVVSALAGALAADA
ncbi:DegT/DnrJ/EryC1/StrS family aminotransferase [Hyphomicrobium sp. D-2]|uniref:DegT/DnrJ/EryC1/StrS family aminotransferase n=1 Tax=Hyphomicrobium sp. D-2 TaxID=3041621 RepID=UPI002454E8D2|nr:DegT/DnrJ/EryC1/StrS family aminotransferase [Hyphomicrobium sp. D-2]MDH4982739.1 DegT/DnrJ/EryC1/StrS family aminotransferase [Hyphomicrobium sp. D-2]